MKCIILPYDGSIAIHP